jgi:hypothetical protein
MLRFLYNFCAISLVPLTACTQTMTINDVRVIKKIAQPNQFCEYQYLTLPKSASEEELQSITTKIKERDERSTKWTIYNYYLENDRDKSFAVLHGFYGGKPPIDKIEVIKHNQRKNLEFDKALQQIQKFKNEKSYTVSDSCFGVWRNWANPIPIYVILYKKGNEYFVESFNPDLGFGTGKEKAIREKSLASGVALRYEHQEWIGFTKRDKKNTYRYTLNEFGDITWFDQYGDSAAHVQGVYNYVCSCDYQQDTRELKSKQP